MRIYSDVFARKEMKYRLAQEQLATITPALTGKLAPTEFDDTTVRSLYYDTPAHDLISRSIESPIFKEKLRLRLYGNETHPTTPAFVEIKKKFKGIVYKRRVTLPLAGAEAFLDGMPYERAIEFHPFDSVELAEQVRSIKSRQIAREIEFFMQRHGPLVPSILTMCMRQSFADPNGSDLRVTIDTHLQAKDAPASIEDTHLATPIIPNDEAIMEIKSSTALPLWLTSSLSKAQAYKQPFSKCGNAYEQSRSSHEVQGSARPQMHMN